MRHRGALRIALVLLALFAACSPFGSSSDDDDEPTTPTKPDGSTALDATGPTGDSAPPTDAGPLFASCANAPTNLFCDDFTAQSWAAWKYPSVNNPFNPTLQDAPDAGVHFDSPADAPSPPIAVFEFPNPAGFTFNDSGTCGYAWSRELIDLTAHPIDHVTVSFDMRVVKTDPGNGKESIALITVKDEFDQVIENYVTVRDPQKANIYEQWTSNVLQNADHAIGDLSQPRWVHFDFTFQTKDRSVLVTLDGVSRSWKTGQEQFGSSITKVVVGIGYSCTQVGGIVQFDNVLVTSE